MPAFALKLTTLATNDPNPGEFVILLKPEHKQTLAHAMDLRGEFSIEKAEGYALLDYPPSWHLAEFRANRLARYLTRALINRSGSSPLRGSLCQSPDRKLRHGSDRHAVETAVCDASDAALEHPVPGLGPKARR